MITDFSGDYGFLSNFYASRFIYQGTEYATVEHAFQASKAIHHEDREQIRKAKTPGEAKRLGQKVELRPDWENVKVSVMKRLLHLKFKDEVLKSLLEATDAHQLVEGNVWHDQIWGDCYCGYPSCKKPGQNLLGKLLMRIRKEIKEGKAK